MAQEKYIISRTLIRIAPRVEALSHVSANHLIAQSMADVRTRRYAPSVDTGLGHQAKQHIGGFRQGTPQFQKKLGHHMIRKNSASPWGMIGEIPSAQTRQEMIA